MTEEASYWICECGSANFRTQKVCSKCKKTRRRTRKKILYISMFLIVLVLVGASTGNKKTTSISSIQKEFLDSQSNFVSRYKSAENNLAKADILTMRDKALVKFENVLDWNGRITGIDKMSDRAAVSVDVGGVVLLAGVYLGKGIDTLIDVRNQPLYDDIRTLRVGDEVLISGRFMTQYGRLVEISYLNSNAARSPQFLFSFTNLKKKKI